MFEILNALNICSSKNTRISWCGNVILEKQINSLEAFITLSDKPKVPPITNVILLEWFKEIWLIFSENSGDVYCFPLKSRVTTYEFLSM